jgi:hypothetical protein
VNRVPVPGVARRHPVERETQLPWVEDAAEDRHGERIHARDLRERMIEKQLRKALLASLESIEYALRLDSAAEVLEESEVRQIDDFEREQTAHVLGELRKLERRWPAPTP